ncbi:MAG: DUF4960 domain-containing protein [Prevotella sp.]|nr:DUF4960 domain-containing protein [Prevotella sp.]
MKTKITTLLIALIAFLALGSCSDDNVSDLQLSGLCSVDTIALDEYAGAVDQATRTITVRVPETYDVSNMTLAKLGISEGATSNIKEGNRLNMTAPQVISINNGDVFLDWTIKVIRDEARISSFKINGTYNGVIDEANKTISVYVPNSVNIKALTPTIVFSDNATITPASGVPTDFSNPVVYTVSNNTAKSAYTVTVTAIGKPTAVFVGLSATMDELPPEEQTACQWMLQNIPNSLYASFDDIKNGTVDLSECKVIWWHYHKDGGVDGKEAFERAAPAAVNAAVALRDYYNNGGSFLFTRYATNMPAEIGAVANNAAPNNCWGQNEAEAEKVNDPWSFSIQGHTDHPLFKNLVMKDGEPNALYTCDAGYRITNSTAQWHIGTDWGGYADYNAWRSETGAQDIGYGGDGAIVAWEFPANGTKGKIICIGSGCYDWYSIDDVASHFHDNIGKMTMNAFNYLMNK